MSATSLRTPEVSTMLQEALWLAEHDVPVFPCHTPVGLNRCSCGNPRCDKIGKHRRTVRGFKDATTDPGQIEQWWKDWPNANIAIPTGTASGLFVLDTDPRNGGPVDRCELQQRLGPIPTSAAEVYTGGGGRHTYFQFNPQQFTNPTIPRSLEAGVDLKGPGGYVLAPPSLHVSGKHYS